MGEKPYLPGEQYKNQEWPGGKRIMTESVITEFTGNQRETVGRLYRYGTAGVTVLDSHNAVQRLYRFDPSSNTMTENDPRQPGKILRRFVFDNYGMLEETFSFGRPPRTFNYEPGGRQIVMREGGEYGAVGKTFTFEGSGVTETAFGRDGNIERVYSFDPKNETITIRSGGWYGDIERRLVFERLDVSVFCEPEAFLQFLMFTEKSAGEAEAEIDEQVAKIRAQAPGKSRFAYNGPQHSSNDRVPAVRSQPGPQSRPTLGRSHEERTMAGNDDIIDFIPDGASSSTAKGSPSIHDRSNAIPFEERWQRGNDDEDKLKKGESDRIPLEERFRSVREQDRTLTAGRSASIPLDERFQNVENKKEELTPGRSTQISYEERRTGKRQQ